MVELEVVGELGMVMSLRRSWRVSTSGVSMSRWRVCSSCIVAVWLVLFMMTSRLVLNTVMFTSWRFLSAYLDERG